METEQEMAARLQVHLEAVSGIVMLLGPKDTLVSLEAMTLHTTVEEVIRAFHQWRKSLAAGPGEEPEEAELQGLPFPFE